MHPSTGRFGQANLAVVACGGIEMEIENFLLHAFYSKNSIASAALPAYVSSDSREVELGLGGFGMQKAKRARKNTKSTQSTGKKRRWVANVKTDSTHPPAGLFTKSATAIARSLASPKVSPKGPASGMRMLNYFINRAGKGLSRVRLAELERAKALLSERIEDSKRPSGSASSGHSK
jgi:hypothetical protein